MYASSALSSLCLRLPRFASHSLEVLHVGGVNGATYDMQLIHYSYFLSFLIIPKVVKMSELVPLPHL